jgi:hypothetical protein
MGDRSRYILSPYSRLGDLGIQLEGSYHVPRHGKLDMGRTGPQAEYGRLMGWSSCQVLRGNIFGR